MSPTLLKVVSVATFVIFRCGDCAAGTVLSAHCLVAGGPVTHAVSLNDPASRSVWVTVWVPVHTIESPGASGEPLAGVQEKLSSAGVSSTVALASVVLPSFVAVIV